MRLEDQLATLLESCRRCAQSGKDLWQESQRSVLATRKAIAASKARIEQSDRTLERLQCFIDDPPKEPQPAAAGLMDDVFEVISGRTFQDEVVMLDGRHFIECTLNQCTLLYSGQPVMLESTGFHGCCFRFHAEAALTVQFLETFELLLSDSRATYTAVPTRSLRQLMPN